MAGISSKRHPHSTSQGTRSSGGRVRRQPATRPANELDLNRAALNPDHQVAGLQVILQKELRNSDISQLGRIILKREAEAYLPFLASKEEAKVYVCTIC